MRLRSHAVVGLLSLVLLAFGLPALAEPSATQDGSASSTSTGSAVPWMRLAGETRYETAVRIGQHRFPSPTAADRAETVYLARADVPVDALVGGALTDGPVLLVRSCGSLPAVVKTEIARLDPERVVALGGTGAVCDAVLTTAAAGRPTARLAGTNRYGTAVAISRHVFPTAPVEELYVASAAESPDPVAGGVLTRGPVLLVPPTGTVPASVLKEVRRLQPGRVVALGGTTAVSGDVLAQAAQGRPTERLSGSNRYSTAVAIARHQFPAGGRKIYLARGDVFADAIAGGVLIDGPVLLVPPTCGQIPRAVTEYLGSIPSPSYVVGLGGHLAVCDDTITTAATMLALQVSPTTPPAPLGQPYSHQFTVSGDTAPYTWRVTAGGLPPGLSLGSATGLLRGTPSSAGAYDLSMTVTGSTGRDATVDLRLVVTTDSSPALGTVTGVSSSGALGDHRCAVTSTGGAVCWGDNEFGQLGDGTTVDRVIPVPVSGLSSGVTQVATGYRHSCAVRTDGSAWCWGHNGRRQLGSSGTWRSTVPVRAAADASFTQLTAGSLHTCGRTTGGAAICWGADDDGQLGNDDPGTVVHGLGTGVRSLSAGGRHTCAVTDAGAALCWGLNTAGQLGDGTTTDRPTPVTVLGLGTGVTDVAAGDRHTCAVRDGGALCWGVDMTGRLGRGTPDWTVHPPSPVVGLGTGVARVAVASDSSCAVTTGGDAFCWGYNEDGRLGDGTARSTGVPRPVATGPGTVAQVSPGDSSSCFVPTSGVPVCSGDNAAGQLGSGNVDAALVPVRVLGFG